MTNSIFMNSYLILFNQVRVRIASMLGRRTSQSVPKIMRSVFYTPRARRKGLKRSDDPISIRGAEVSTLRRSAHAIPLYTFTRLLSRGLTCVRRSDSPALHSRNANEYAVRKARISPFRKGLRSSTVARLYCLANLSRSALPI